MKQIKNMLFIGTGLLLGAITSVQAEMPLPVGWYGEANIGMPEISHVDYASNSSNTTSGVAWNLNVGYKFLPFFGLEGGYTNYATTNAENNNIKVAKATSQAYDLAGKAILPIQNSGFEFIAKLGVDRAKTHVTNSNNTYASAHGITVNAGTHQSTALFYGVGGEYAFSPSMLVNAQWTRSNGSSSSTGNLDLYSVGVSYIFS